MNMRWEGWGGRGEMGPVGGWLEEKHVIKSGELGWKFELHRLTWRAATWAWIQTPVSAAGSRGTCWKDERHARLAAPDSQEARLSFLKMKERRKVEATHLCCVSQSSLTGSLAKLVRRQNESKVAALIGPHKAELQLQLHCAHWGVLSFTCKTHPEEPLNAHELLLKGLLHFVHQILLWMFLQNPGFSASADPYPNPSKLLVTWCHNQNVGPLYLLFCLPWKQSSAGICFIKCTTPLSAANPRAYRAQLIRRLCSAGQS